MKRDIFVGDIFVGDIALKGHLGSGHCQRDIFVVTRPYYFYDPKLHDRDPMARLLRMLRVLRICACVHVRMLRICACVQVHLHVP